MTITEVDFQDRVESWLLNSFSMVEKEVTLDSGRRPDFIAYTPFDSYVVEVENSLSSLYDGIGQAMVYAEETGFEPVLVFPAEAGEIEHMPEEVNEVRV